MRKFLHGGLLFLICLLVTAPAYAELFSFPVESYRLDNGMEVVLIKCGDDGVMMDFLAFDVGMRSEKKPEEIEYTHLMEHLMFRDSEHYPVEKVDEYYAQYGVYSQGYTASDYTCYYRIFPREAFRRLTEIMTDKLSSLVIPDDQYRAETGAVLGEYLGHYRMPLSMLDSKLYQIAYTIHPYRDMPEHLDTLKKMPENRERVMKFYRDYYKPNHCRLVVAGDIDEKKVREIIRQNYGSLKCGKDLPEVPPEPPQGAERRADILYPGKTSPYLSISYHIPGYDPQNIEIPAIDLIQELSFSESSPLYKRLVYEEKIATTVDFPGSCSTRDPGLFTTIMKLKDKKDIEKAKEIFFQEVDSVRKNPCDPEKLRQIKEKRRFETLTNLDSLNRIAFTYARPYFLSGNTRAAHLYYDNYFRVKPSEIKAAAEKYFAEKNRIVVTLTEGKDAHE
ncbi:MAG: pitrilysin family protein [Candidatus Eremiobacteraeota bacterium]|nr:pitrilysin family protein [Candidatus Eremiobacteraeota bacterium]